MPTLPSIPFASAEEIAHANSHLAFVVGTGVPSADFEKTEVNRRVTLTDLVTTLAVGIPWDVAEETDLVVIGAQTVDDITIGEDVVADHATTETAINALQVAVDALIVRVNLIKNQYQ